MGSKKNLMVFGIFASISLGLIVSMQNCSKGFSTGDVRSSGNVDDKSAPRDSASFANTSAADFCNLISKAELETIFDTTVESVDAKRPTVGNQWHIICFVSFADEQNHSSQYTLDVEAETESVAANYMTNLLNIHSHPTDQGAVHLSSAVLIDTQADQAYAQTQKLELSGVATLDTAEIRFRISNKVFYVQTTAEEGSSLVSTLNERSSKMAKLFIQKLKK